MIQATIVRVLSEIEVAGQRATALWLVATGDAAEAERAVRERVTAGCEVEATDIPVAPETLDRLNLAPGQAWHL